MGHWARYWCVATPLYRLNLRGSCGRLARFPAVLLFYTPKAKSSFLALQGLPGKPHKKRPLFMGPFWERLKFTLYIQIRALLRRRTLGARRRWPGDSIYTQCAVGVRFESPKNTIPPPRLGPFFEGFCATK